jgi:K+/H+ antiporter YhaU regulatory subunit KhtT
MQVCKISKNDKQMGSLAKDVGGWFNTYRYKLQSGIVNLAKEFNTINKNVTEYDELLEEFITEDVWKQLLNTHLKATNQQKLKKNDEIISKIGLFIRQATKATIIALKRNEKTKSIIKGFDEYTIDLNIPTKLGIAGTLALQEFLD